MNRMNVPGARALTLTFASLVVLFRSRPAEASEPREHDGIYLRFGGGFGFSGDSVSSTDSLGERTEATPKGFAVATEIAIGGSVKHGLVVGGGIYSNFMPSPSASNVTQAGAQSEDITYDGTSFHVIGPFVDFYPRSGGGFHLQAAPGLGVQKTGGAKGAASGLNYAYSQTDTGFAFMLGVGNEWWVGKNWGLGILGRFTMGILGGEDDDKVHWNHTVVAPAVLFTATMN